MKIAFIGKFKKIYDEEGKALSLEKLGHEVIRFDENLFNQGFQTGWTNNLDFLLSYKPDVVIYTKLRVPNNIEVIKKLQSNNILTVSWYPDYSFDWNEGLGRLGSDLLLIPDSQNKDRWRSLGINQHCVRQGIYHEMCHVGKEIPNLEKDILFVGSLNSDLYKHRIPLIDFLKGEYGDRFLHMGGQNSDEIRNHSLNDVIKSVKITIGDSLYAPYYWSNRIYETMGRGGFILHSYVEGIDKEYEIGKHFDVYKTFGKNGWGRQIDFDDLKSKIELYLNNNKLRNRMAKNGMKYTIRSHTLLNRSKQVVDIITNELESKDKYEM